MEPSQLVRKGITPSDARRNPVMENMSVGAFQTPDDGFVARLVFPTIPSATQEFKYYEIDVDSISQDKAKPRAPGTAAEEGTWDLTLKEGLCEAFGYREKLPEELIQTTGEAAAADETSALSVAEVLAINEEVRWGTAFFKTGVWAHDMIGQATADATHYVFWNRAGATPVDDVYAERTLIRKACRRFPNTLLLGADVAPKLLTHPTIIGRLNNGQTPGGLAMASLADLAKLFMVDRVIIASAVYNSAKEGQAASNGFILGSKSAWLGYVNPKPAKRSVSAGYRFTWAGLAGNDEGLRNWKYWQQDIRSWWVEGALDDTFKLVSGKCGTFFSLIVE